MSRRWPSEGPLSTIPAIVEATAERQPDSLFLRDEAGEQVRCYSFGDVARQMHRVAAALAAAGARAGDIVGLVAPNGAFLVDCFLGAQRLGAIPIVIDPPNVLRSLEDYHRETVDLLNQVGASGLVVAREFGHALSARSDIPTLRYVLDEEACSAAAAPSLPGPPRDPGALSHIQQTSGTTERRRAVMVTHGNVVDSVHAMALAAAFTSDDRMVSWLPLSHDMGLIGGLLTPLLLGRPLLLMSPLRFIVKPVSWLRAISEFRGTATLAPTFGYQRCVSVIREADLQGVDSSSLRGAVCGAEPVLRSTVDAFERRFKSCGLRDEVIYPAYGLAECTLPVTSRGWLEPPRYDEIDYETLTVHGRAVRARDSSGAIAVCSVGRTLPGTTIAVVDEAGSPLADRMVGEVAVKGRGVTPGYHGDNVASERSFRDGWLYTGDCGYLANEELFLTGRKKHLIIKAGRNFHPEEFESTVAGVSDVRAAVAFGVAAPEVGTERIVVMVESRPLEAAARDVMASACHRRIRDRLGVAVDEVVVIAPPDVILKTTTGKLQRAENRRIYLQMKGLSDESGRRLAVT